MFLIVGLGNPGEKYENTRHNAGFMVLEELAAKLGCELSRSGYRNHCLIAKSEIASQDIWLVEPGTYMNESGLAVGEITREHKTSPEQIIVIHDDTEFPLGEVRVKFGGTSGGHNGIKSIDEAITHEYWRVRIGVGRPENRDYDLADYVLGNFTTAEQETLKAVIDQTTSYLIKSLEEGIINSTSFSITNA